jgi:hypothetical protein
MVMSDSDEEFQSTMDLVFQYLYNQVPRNGELELKLFDFAEKRCVYASCLLAQIPGNHGLRGNACSKQNSWGVISHLNPGVAKDGNIYCEHIGTLIKDLLQHQKAHTGTTHQLLEGICQKMWLEIGYLRSEPQTCLVQDCRKL